ncbi:hypothetical protein SFC57_24150 [Niallia circulans]|uniref:hypothetical protein n=1 Tax=Bacillaceae TaxID=186817 RepID=UPI003979491B
MLNSKERFIARKTKEINKKQFKNEKELNLFVYHSFNTKQMSQVKRNSLMSYIEGI